MENKDSKKPQPTREAQPERESRPESREGEPGYGQPPPEVREKKLPNQNW